MVTLKSKFKLQIVIGIFVLCIVMFGVRLMGKVTDFAYYERTFITSIIKFDSELFKGQPEKSKGRGFAVVADEVRTLAQRTQTSTTEIQSMIENLLIGTREAVAIMERSKEQAQSSVEKTNQAGEAIEEIASAAEEQSVVTTEINNNTKAINEVADKTAIGGQNAAKSNEELVVLSKQLESIVSTFKIA